MSSSPFGHRVADIADSDWAEPLRNLGIFFVGCAVLLAGLWKGALLDWDEAIYAEIAKEMVNTHRWLALQWQHVPFYSKPPLTLWIEAGFFRLFGIREFTARLESALAGAATVLLVYLISRHLSGRFAGFVASGALLTTRHFDQIVRHGTTDGPLCLCIMLAVYAYLRLRRGDERWFYVLCAAIGAGAMIKGPAILIAPAAIALDAIIRRTRLPLSTRHWIFGALLIAVIVLPWHLWMFVHFGRPFLDNYIGREVFQRAAQPLDGHYGGPLYYIKVVAVGAFPWNLFAVAALAWRIRRRDWRGSVLWLLAGVTFLLYTVVSSKVAWYIAPVYPALAVEVGALLALLTVNRAALRNACATLFCLALILTGWRFAHSNGDALTNDVAHLAAESNCQPTPLLLVIDLPGATPELDSPTAVFYSNHPAESLVVPDDDPTVRQALLSSHNVKAIVRKEAIGVLAVDFNVAVISTSDTLAYVAISEKSYLPPS